MILPLTLLGSFGIPFVADLSANSAPQVNKTAVLVGVTLAFLVVFFAALTIARAVRKRTGGPLIAAAAGSCFVIAAIAIGYFGIMQGVRNAWKSERITRSGTPSETLTGIVLPFTIEKPAGWWVRRSQGAYDVLMSDNDSFIGVIAEPDDLGTAEKVAALARERIDGTGTEVTFTDNEKVTIDGRPWVSFTAKCKVQNQPFAYQYYVTSGKDGTIQIMGWMYQKFWPQNAESTRKVMLTLKLPPPAAASAPNP